MFPCVSLESCVRLAELKVVHLAKAPAQGRRGPKRGADETQDSMRQRHEKEMNC